MKPPDDFRFDAGVLTHKTHEFDITIQQDLLQYRHRIHVFRRGAPVLNAIGKAKRFTSRAHAIRFVRQTIELERT